MTYLRDDIAAEWQGQDPLQVAFALKGEVFRDVPGRLTSRVDIGGSYFFVKLHFGVGWPEIIKNWLQLKRPIVGAHNEYVACRDLNTLGIRAPTPAAYAASQDVAAKRRSFVLCEELAGYTSLEDLTELWQDQPPTPIQRQRLLYAVAKFARTFHDAGFVHRDFYICHLLVRDDAWREGRVELAVLDLHRARRFSVLPDKWRKRDMAALLFSTLDFGFSQRHWLRFLRIYSGQPLRDTIAQRGGFWSAVVARANRLYVEGRKKGIVKGLYQP